MNESLRSVLPSLGLSEERCGRNRGSHLAPAELDLYRWILRSFASGESPSRADVAHAARSLAMEGQAALKRMVEDDLIQRSASGEIDCAYPFSARPTTHVVTLDDGVRLYAMCAIDALGIPSCWGIGVLLRPPILLMGQQYLSVLPLRAGRSPSQMELWCCALLRMDRARCRRCAVRSSTPSNRPRARSGFL